MKKYSLSGPRQKIICSIIIIFLLVVNLIMFSYPSLSSFSKYSFFIFTLVLCFFYAYIIFYGNVIIDTINHSVTISTFKKVTINLRNVKRIEIEDHKVQNRVVKVIVFYDYNDTYVGEIDTFFSPKQTKLSESLVSACREAI